MRSWWAFEVWAPHGSKPRSPNKHKKTLNNRVVTIPQKATWSRFWPTAKTLIRANIVFMGLGLFCARAHLLKKTPLRCKAKDWQRHIQHKHLYFHWFPILHHPMFGAWILVSSLKRVVGLLACLRIRSLLWISAFNMWACIHHVYCIPWCFVHHLICQIKVFLVDPLAFPVQKNDSHPNSWQQKCLFIRICDPAKCCLLSCITSYISLSLMKLFLTYTKSLQPSKHLIC